MINENDVKTTGRYYIEEGSFNQILEFAKSNIRDLPEDFIKEIGGEKFFYMNGSTFVCLTKEKILQDKKD